MTTPENCRETTTNPRIVVSEKGRRFELLNGCRQRVVVVRVDGCLVQQGTRCDYLFEIGDPCRQIIFLELKGMNVARAVEQLEATLQQLRPGYRGYEVIAHVVASRVPRAGTNLQTLRDAMQRKYGALLHVKSDQATVNICP